MAVTKITNAEYQNLATGSDKPIVLDFYADWCGPCRMLAPVFDEVAEEHPADYLYCRVNVDEEPALASRFGISVIPTLVRVDKGNVLDESTGYLPKEELLSFLKL